MARAEDTDNTAGRESSHERRIVLFVRRDERCCAKDWRKDQLSMGSSLQPSDCQRLGEDRIRLGSEDLIALGACDVLEGAEVVFQRGERQ